MLAVRALVRIKDAPHADVIVDRLERFLRWSPRYLSSVLAGMGLAVAPVLRRTLVDPGRSEAVREIAADTLRKLKDREGAEAAVQAIEGFPARDLLGAALRFLRVVATPNHLSLIRRLAGSPDDVVRGHALRILAGIGGPDDGARLRSGLEDPSPWVATHAAWGLLESGRSGELREVSHSNHPRADLARQVLQEAQPA